MYMSGTLRARGYSVERFQMDSESLFLSHQDEDVILTTRSLQDLTRIQAVPPVPPRPWRNKMVKATSASALNCRSLNRGYNNFTFPGDRPYEQMEDPDVPPPIPLRSRSRDHFYHTLECPENGDSGVASVSSPQYSQQRSNNSSHSSSHDQAELEDGKPEQAQQLFDDPRYAALQVEGADLGERWRSTPSLTSTQLLGGGRERRSLRLTHVVGTELHN